MALESAPSEIRRQACPPSLSQKNRRFADRKKENKTQSAVLKLGSSKTVHWCLYRSNTEQWVKWRTSSLKDTAFVFVRGPGKVQSPPTRWLDKLWRLEMCVCVWFYLRQALSVGGASERNDSIAAPFGIVYTLIKLIVKHCTNISRSRCKCSPHVHEYSAFVERKPKKKAAQ